MNPAEWLALGGLIRLMLQADGKVTPAISVHDCRMVNMWPTTREPMATFVQSMMDAETWLDGPSAVEKGFADKLTGKEEPKARFDLSVFAKAPDELKGQLPDRVFTTERDAERFLTRDAGLSRSNAQELIAACASPTAKRDAGRGEAFTRDAEGAGDLFAAMERLNRTIQESIHENRT